MDEKADSKEDRDPRQIDDGNGAGAGQKGPYTLHRLSGLDEGQLKGLREITARTDQNLVMQSYYVRIIHQRHPLVVHDMVRFREAFMVPSSVSTTAALESGAAGAGRCLETEVLAATVSARSRSGASVEPSGA
jgi:hypothetical protein